MGRLADQEDILRALRVALPGAGDLAGLKVVVSAGGTREDIDPVRYIGNRSSGLMGHAVAAVAEARGASVVLVTSSALPVPLGVEAHRVDSAREMAGALGDTLAGADILVMAAAVADFRPRDRSLTKLRKDDMPSELALKRNPDILGSLPPKAAPGQGMVRVGFAAETHDMLARAQEKLMAKGLDMIVANDVSDPSIGMGSPENAVTVLTRDGSKIELPRASKEEIADRILSVALELGKAARAGSGSAGEQVS
jgi:phosphopantothenoylcysteine decarboxylase/phosphopantothenate--cysteine ligase